MIGPLFSACSMKNRDTCFGDEWAAEKKDVGRGEEGKNVHRVTDVGGQNFSFRLCEES